MIKKINSDDYFNGIISEKNNGRTVVLYGAGNYGITLSRYLQKKYDTEIDCFAVSDGQDKQESVNAKPVFFLSEIDRNCILIITVSEQKQKSLIENAENSGFTDIYVILNDFIRYVQSELIDNRLTPLEKLSFEVHVTEHCNLNCKGCYHFSPVAQKEFLAIEEYESDLKRIEALCGQKVRRITLLGGEPLLHPQISVFFKVTREIFPSCRIDLLTNGVLLPQMGREFWEECVKQNISLHCTKYPVDIDYNAIEDMANQYGLRIGYHNDVGAGEKTLIKYPFDITGSQDISWNYKHCTRSNLCITLKHGKIYTCPMAAHAHLAKDYFHLDLDLSPRDYIDIYKAKTMEEITNFLINPIPFCKYCNLKSRPEQIQWEQSKKKLEEWF